MARLKRGRSKRLVIDIGSSSIRVCELAQTKAGFQLTKYKQRDLPIDPSMDEEAVKEAQINTLRDLLKEAKIRHKKVVFAVPGQSVFTRTRALPPVQEHKVTQIVRYEIQQQIPFSLDQIALDYQVLKRTEAGGYEVLMAAIKVDVVEKHLEVINGVKRSVDIVDVAPLAAYNWLKHTGEFGEEGECVAFVDLGASTTEIVIERENQFRFTRSLNVGGNDITEAIAEAFNMSYADAEKLKRERGFAPTGDEKRDGKGGEVIGKVLNRLVNEVNRSFAFFRTQPGGGTVSRVIVAGGGACLRNMIPYMQRQLGVEVKIAQPLAGLAIAPPAQEANEFPEQAATALGLALRTQESSAIEVNLIPPRILELARAKEQTFYWALSIATLALIMASIIPVKANENNMVLADIETMEKFLEQYDPALLVPGADVAQPSAYEEELEAEKQKIGTFQTQLAALNQTVEGRTYWLDYLVDIALARPEGKGVWISSIETTIIGRTEVAGEQRRNDDDGGGGGLFGGLAGVGNMNLSSRGGPKMSDRPRLNTTGFTGLQPMATSAGRGGEPTVLAPPRPNGLTVYGYAKDPATIREFIERLESSGKFVKVYFDASFSDPVELNELEKARTSGGGGMAARRNRGEEEDEGGGFGGGLANIGRGGANVQRQQVAPQYQQQRVYSFRIDLQFRGEPVALGEDQSEADAAAAAPQAPVNPFQGFNLGGDDE
jgi:type IV pilus assembly protein PilM